MVDTPLQHCVNIEDFAFAVAGMVVTLFKKGDQSRSLPGDHTPQPPREGLGAWTSRRGSE